MQSAPVFKNLDRRRGHYDVHNQGWRWYLKPDGTTDRQPFRD
jgi:hypothetical protein